MDCERALEILLEAADGLAAPEAVAEAEAHCETCAECARVRAGLKLLASAPAPKAPAGLVDAVLEAVRDERQRAVEHAAAAVTTATPPEPASMPARWRWQGWERRFAGFAAAAAIVVVGLVAVGLAIPRVASVSQQAIVKSADEYGAEKTVEPPLATQPQTESSYGDVRASTIASAPPYVTLEGMVFVLDGVERSSPSSLATAGAVVSALDDPDSDPATMTVLAEPVEPSPTAIWVAAPDGRILRFRLVTRSYAGDAFALESGTPIARFGEWPTLPARFAPPTAPDGSPTFRYFGSDDGGVRIYVPAGARPLDGFAVAPGTSPDDPAAGNPNWTWWVRLD